LSFGENFHWAYPNRSVELGRDAFTFLGLNRLPIHFGGKYTGEFGCSSNLSQYDHVTRHSTCMSTHHSRNTIDVSFINDLVLHSERVEELILASILETLTIYANSENERRREIPVSFLSPTFLDATLTKRPSFPARKVGVGIFPILFHVLWRHMLHEELPELDYKRERTPDLVTESIFF
jgi:hypothetical protein